LAALVVSGAYRLAGAVSNNPPMTPDQMNKFAAYFMSRLTVQTPKGAYSLLDVLNILTTNKVGCRPAASGMHVGFVALFYHSYEFYRVTFIINQRSVIFALSFGEM